MLQKLSIFKCWKLFLFNFYFWFR